MRMARVNVYLPDDLAAEAKEAGLNVSNLTQKALRSTLAGIRVDEWLGCDAPAAHQPQSGRLGGGRCKGRSRG